MLGGIGRSSFFAEKQALVLCFGEAFTKVGLAGENRPRAIFRSPELRRRRMLGPELSGTLSQEEWVQVLSDFMNRIFFQHLHLSPKDRRVVICDGVYSSQQFRSALAFVLFKLFAVPSVCFVLELVLPLYLTGLHSGLVVDLGFGSAKVLPSSAGVPLLSAFSDANCGTKAVLQAIKKALMDPAAGNDGILDILEDETVLEDVLVCACYVTCDFPKDREQPARSLKSDKDAEVRLLGRDRALKVPAACRHGVTECFFHPQSAENHSCACDTLPEAFVRTLELCPMDIRAQLVQNVVICGGGATLRGLLPRLALEVQKALQQHKVLSALAPKLRLTPVDFAPICAAWTGGAIYGSLEGVPDYSAEDFRKGAALPDWLRSGFV